MSYVLRLLRSAERDIAEGIAWYRTQEPGLDADFLLAIDTTLKRVSKAPTRFAKRVGDYQPIHVQRFPYVIYYRLVGQEIRVAAILHHRRGQKARDRRLPVRQ